MDDGETRTEAQGGRRGLPLWAKLLAGCSILLMITGLALPFAGGDEQPRPAPDHTGTAPAGVTGFSAGGMEDVGDAGPNATAQPDAGVGAWGPSVFRMGFSFFVGFAVAYALRSFLKLAVAALGFFFMALFGLQYAGLVEVQWGAMSDRYQQIAGGLEEHARGAWDSAKVLLPSAAAASAGLFAGFWRRAV